MTSTTTKLPILRRQLADLRRARQTLRWGTAHSATAIAILWLLAGLWAVDVAFELSVVQRALMLAFVGIGIVWSFVRFTRPLLGVRESELDLALKVERQLGIDSDLVAALQFESPAAQNWGSRDLEAAVIDRVASLGSGLDVFAGFSRQQLVRRATVLVLTTIGVLLAALIFPDYARVFWNRLLLGHRHYPTATRIERVVIGDTSVLLRDHDDTTPRTLAAAQGQPLTFLVVCSGVLPERISTRIAALAGGTSRLVELTPIGSTEREQRLAQVEERLQAALAAGEPSFDGEQRLQLLATLSAELPEVANRWRDAEAARATWPQVLEALTEGRKSWEAAASKQQVYQGELGRLVDSARYKLHAGDAWTDPADIHMTPRPTLDVRFTSHSPSYARDAEATRELGPRQLSVLEGSQVEVAVQCTNGKPLAEAWLALKSPDGIQRIDLVAAASDGLQWKLPSDATAFSPVTRDVRFTVQVRDRDGLGLETPLAGLVRIKADRPPQGSIDVVHRVVLPQAKPAIHFRATDDYGIAKLLLHLEHERPQNDRATGEQAGREPTAPTSESTADQPVEPSTETSEAARQTIALLEAGAMLRGEQLPINGQREVSLATLGLAKGDRLKLTLEVVDYRGDRKGESTLSEPVFLEISDEAGVLGAILEADERSEQRLSDLIKRQLGIREAP